MAKTFRERVKKITITPLPFYLTVVVTTSINESITKRQERLHWTTPHPDVRACVYGGEDMGTAWMFLPEGAPTATIVHECAHVIWFALHYAGIDLGNELLAYNIGHLSNEVGAFVCCPVKPKARRRPRR